MTALGAVTAEEVVVVGFDIRPRPERRAPAVGVGGLPALEPRPSLGDVEFLFAVARRLARQAGVDSGTHSGAGGANAAARGTVDALLWVLGATDSAPSGLRHVGRVDVGLRSDDLLAVELVALENQRAVLAGAVDGHYLRGAADAVCFARGWGAAFWWAPLPAVLRPHRDEIGRRVA